MSLAGSLLDFESALDAIAAAERGEGWLVACDQARRYLLPCREFVAVLAGLLRRLPGPALEVCAGDGELARMLRAEGVDMIASDSAPVVGGGVERAPADEALARYRPAVVLGSFVPFDSGVDRQVLCFPTVRHYLVLGARIHGLFGSSALWESPGWSAEPLEFLTRWMLTRHDVWLGAPGRPILQHGEAWHLKRVQNDEKNPELRT